MQKTVEITDEPYQIILSCRKTVLKNNDSTWIKTGLDSFDVSMGGYDSAQVEVLVGFYILNTLSRIIDLMQIGLYSDDRILYIPNRDCPLNS